VFKEYNPNAVLSSNIELLNSPIVFYNHFSTSNWPFQSLASIHTGLYVENHGVYNNEFHNDINYKKFNLPEDVLSQNTETMLSAAKKSGFHTIFWGGEPHPSFYSTKTGTMRGADIIEKKCLNYPEQIEQLYQQITNAHNKTFTVVNIARTHFPHFIVPSNFKSQFDSGLNSKFFPKNEEEYLLERKNGWKKINQYLVNNPNVLTPSQVEMKKVTRDAYWYLDIARHLEKEQGDTVFKSHYQKSVEYSFSMIQDLIGKLKKSNKFDKTIVIITSDVGDNYLAPYKSQNPKNNYFFSPFTYMLPSNESFSVPLFIYFPEKLNDSFDDFKELTSHVDLLPTIQFLTGQKNNPPTDGFNFFSNNFPNRKYIHSFSYRPHAGIRLGFHAPKGTLIKHSSKRSTYYDFLTKQILSADEILNNEGSNDLYNISKNYDDLFNNKNLNDISKKVDNIYKN
jgi:arylsulfatase A-like enzyme